MWLGEKGLIQLIERIKTDMQEVYNKLAGKSDSGHTHDDRYYTEAEVDSKLAGKANSNHGHDYVPASASCNKNWIWNGQQGQPTWLWGSNDGSNMYVWSPSNFNVNYANSAGSVAWGNVCDKPSTYPPENHTHNYLSLYGGIMSGEIAMQQNKIKFSNWRMFAHPSNPDQIFALVPREENYTLFFGVQDSMWTVCSWTNGAYCLGSPNHKWGQIYSTTGTISTSDRNYKKDIAPISDQYLRFFTLLQPVTYRFIDGSSGRVHVGFISQDIESAMEQVGLSDLDFAGFCKDKQIHEVVTKRIRYQQDSENNLVLGDDGKPIEEEYDDITYEDVLDEDGNPAYIYSLRYEEFIALEAAVIQRLQAKVDSMESRIEKLEKLIYKENI